MVLSGVGALLLLIATWVGYEVLVGNKRSPPDTAEFNSGRPRRQGGVLPARQEGTAHLGLTAGIVHLGGRNCS